MTPSRPYLLRALYEWIVDNGLTPYVLVDAEYEGLTVPQQYVDDGKIVFNLNPSAVQHLSLGNDFVEFSARFSGEPMQLSLPVMSVLAIYAKENGKGMVFSEEEEAPPPEPGPEGDEKEKRPSLRLVK